MYFIDRISLGNALSGRLNTIRGQDAIIVCLKESSLLTCIELATKLRAWIFPLLYEKIMHPDDPSKVLGAMTQDGEFCLHPNVHEEELEYIMSEFMGIIEDRKREALHDLNVRMSGYGGNLDKHVLNGRPVVLAGDIVTDPLELALTKLLLKPLTPKDVIGVAGNVTIDVSDMFHLSTDSTEILDILPTYPMDDDHYFERRDPYSDDQKRQLALNIKTYWT